MFEGYTIHFAVQVQYAGIFKGSKNDDFEIKK